MLSTSSSVFKLTNIIAVLKAQVVGGKRVGNKKTQPQLKSVASGSKSVPIPKQRHSKDSKEKARKVYGKFIIYMSS